ncbi:hypothetical protein [Azohydromonas caseinilytica]|uniref:Uncharacterized protein n=1 Tax=Azohydromonas caseinilytica TaxID=2728836 RepID=A0A848F9W4_9BURK|nr:hypothetical protein [Azohydromonas caseinilytica]NML14791.1 hypothetical protein [Azohydromonas caseinilytica]
MTTPGLIRLAPGQRQLIFNTDGTNPRWYRIFNRGQSAMGVIYSNSVGNAASLSQTVEPGRSMDFLAYRLEVRHLIGTTPLDGLYEALP